MATRCNIVIENGDSKIYIYRHWDGYPACTGADIANKLRAAGTNPNTFLRSLLTAERGNGDTHPQYELTTSIHGDIEYLYRVRFPSTPFDGGLPKVGAQLVRFGDEIPRAVDVSLGTLADFVNLVNVEVRDANARLVAMGRGGEGLFEEVQS